MKVCMVSTAPPTSCGIANYCIKLVNSLSNYKSNHFIVLADKPESNKNGASVVYRHFQVIRTWKYNSLRYPFQIFRSLLFEKPDIVHVQHEYLIFGTSILNGFFLLLLFLLRFLNKPLIVTMHSVIPCACLRPSFFRKYGLHKDLAPFGKFFIILLTIAIGFFASKVIVHLKSAKRTLVMDYKFKRSKVAIIPHGVDVPKNRLNHQDAKRKLFLEGKRILLFFGFLRPSKGVEHLIEAMPMVMQEYPDAVLLIVGNYHPYLTPNGVDYLRLLKNRVNELGYDSRILFVSRFVPYAELCIFFSACDLVVLPYIEDDILGASGALSSTLGFGRPVVATKVGRFSEDISDGKNGFLVSPCDPKGLAKAIISVFSNSDLSYKMSESLYKQSEERSWTNIAKKHMNFIYD